MFMEESGSNVVTKVVNNQKEDLKMDTEIVSSSTQRHESHNSDNGDVNSTPSGKNFVFDAATLIDGLPSPTAYANTAAPLSKLQFSTRVIFSDVWKYYKTTNEILGTGLSGAVILAERNNRKFAIKTYKKRKSFPRLHHSEAHIYLRVDHPHIARLIEIYETQTHLSFVMEYCAGGELFDRLSQFSSFSEVDAREAALQMLSAISYLHSHSIVHRDLKLENWVYASPDSNLIKLIDLGFSKLWDGKTTNMRSFCGTPAYVCPEILRGKYTNACDMWSFGVILFMILTGSAPFYGSAFGFQADLLQGKFDQENIGFKECSKNCQDFIRKLFVVDPAERMTAMEALHHPWLSQTPPKRIPLNIETLEAMKRFANAHKFKQAALYVMATRLNSDEIKDMHEIFLSFDKTREGTIRLVELQHAMQTHMDVSEKEVADIFSCMDNSGDEQIYYSDFLAAMIETRLDLFDDLIRSTFEKFDVDKSGYVTLDNLKKVFGETYMGVTMEEIIEEFDRKGDGRLDYGEFLVALRGVHTPEVMKTKPIAKKSFFKKFRNFPLLRFKSVTKNINCMSSLPTDSNPNE